MQWDTYRRLAKTTSHRDDKKTQRQTWTTKRMPKLDQWLRRSIYDDKETITRIRPRKNLCIRQRLPMWPLGQSRSLWPIIPHLQGTTHCASNRQKYKRLRWAITITTTKRRYQRLHHEIYLPGSLPRLAQLYQIIHNWKRRRHLYTTTLDNTAEKTTTDALPTTRVQRNNNGLTCRLRSVHQRNVVVRLQSNQDEQRQLRHQGISATTNQNWVGTCSARTTNSHSGYTFQHRNLHIHGQLRHPLKDIFPHKGLKFMRNHQAVLDTANGTINFPHVEMTLVMTDEMKNCNPKPLQIMAHGNQTLLPNKQQE